MKEEMQFILSGDGYQPFLLSICGYSYCDGTYHIHRPHSQVTCFEYVLEGTGTVRSNDKVFHPEAGDIYMLYQGDDHDYFSDSERPWTKVWFNITGELVHSIVSEYGLREVNHVRNLNLLPLFEEMVALSRRDLDTQEVHNRAACQFLNIVQQISSHVRNHQEKAPPDALLLKEYIHRNIERNITVDELSALIYRSQSQTARIFKKAFGVTPYEYILQRKIDAARHMLLNTQLKIREISVRLGFSDEHYFSNCFKQKTGRSPKQFRDENTQRLRWGPEN